MATVSDQLSKLLTHRGIEAEVSQRLKRMPTIVEKIALRESRLDLSRMQDIGGCRVVLPTEGADPVYRVDSIVNDHWGEAVKKRSDYVTNPRRSGYRAIRRRAGRTTHRDPVAEPLDAPVGRSGRGAQ
ncbi:RelA/SpoT domain-containing protein [Actinomyces slackii]|uniref:RelA/SpoT domain-containing protein n=1 Tax=Actinomyces slackii TaxID=52774 RepID=UPI0038BABC75